MSAILSAIGPKAIKAVISAIIAGLTVLIAQLDAGAALDLPTALKAVLAALLGHQGTYWVPNKG